MELQGYYNNPMNEEEILKLFMQQMAKGPMPMPMERFAANMARTSPDFTGPVSLRSVASTSGAPVGMVDAIPQGPATERVPWWEAMLNFDPVGAAYKAAASAGQNVPTSVIPQGGPRLSPNTDLWNLLNDPSLTLPDVFSGIGGIFRGSPEQAAASSVLPPTGGAAPTPITAPAAPIPTPLTGPGTVATPTEVPGVFTYNFAAAPGQGPQAIPAPLPIAPAAIPQMGAAPAVPSSPQASFLAQLTNALATPGVQEALGQFAIALDPTGIGGRLGQAATQGAQAQMSANYSQALQQGRDPFAITGGPGSARGISPQNLELAFRSQLGREQLALDQAAGGRAERETALAEQAAPIEQGISKQNADSQRINAISQLLNAQANLDGDSESTMAINGTLLDGVRQTVANQLYEAARQNKATQMAGPNSTPEQIAGYLEVIDLQKLFASEGGGVDPDMVFNNLPPEVKEQARMTVAEGIYALEQGASFGRVLGGDFSIPSTTEGATMTAAQAEAAPLGAVATVNGVRYRKIASGWEEVQ